MDKILLSAIIGLVAALITALTAFAKLISDKEGKISEFRHQWTSDVRSSISDMLSAVRAYYEISERSCRQALHCNRIQAAIEAEKKADKGKPDNEALIHASKILETLKQEKIKATREIYKSTTLVLMHFKPNAPELASIESKIEHLTSIVEETSSNYDIIRNAADRYKYVHEKKHEAEILCREISLISRLVLKQEWEKVKTGEPGYTKTKNVFKTGSIWGGIVIAVIFGVMTIAEYSDYLVKQHTRKPIQAHSAQTNPTQPTQP